MHSIAEENKPGEISHFSQVHILKFGKGGDEGGGGSPRSIFDFKEITLHSQQGQAVVHLKSNWEVIGKKEIWKNGQWPVLDSVLLFSCFIFWFLSLLTFYYGKCAFRSCRFL